MKKKYNDKLNSIKRIMNKNIIYLIAAVLLGLILGYVFFGLETDEKTQDHDHGMDEATQWTCSMHPQILQNEPGNCPICGMELISTVMDDTGLSENQFTLTENALALANIQTTFVGQSTPGAQALQISGKVMENKETIGVQSSYFNGRIEKLYVNFPGEEVRKGQRLALLYSPELVAAQQELLTAATLKNSQPKLYKAVRNKLRLWKLTENQIDKIESLGQVEEYFTLFSDISGTVTEILVQAGDYVKKGQAVLNIADLSTVWCVFDLYESQIALLKEGEDIQISTTAYPSKSWDAKISFINPILNYSTRTVEVRATIKNEDNLLKPGMFVKGDVLFNGGMTRMNTIVVPESAILWTGEKSVVYLKTDHTKPVFEMREILLGDKSSAGYTVLEGLSAGDEIVTNGTFTVDAAAQLKGKPSMMNKEGGYIPPAHDHGNEGTNDADTIMSDDTHNNQAVQADFSAIIDGYLNLKDALVASDKDRAAEFAGVIAKAVERSNTEAPNNEELALLSEIGMEASDMSKSKSLEDQRRQFRSLSDNLIKFTKTIDQLEKTLYIQHCPMANQNNGADWLSMDKEIRNPYFGTAMLTCGSLVHTIQRLK